MWIVVPEACSNDLDDYRGAEIEEIMNEDITKEPFEVILRKVSNKDCDDDYENGSDNMMMMKSMI